MGPDEFLRAACKNGLLVDTNVLIVLLIGAYNPAYISKCEKTSAYGENDFIYLKRLLAETKAKIIVTPHILAEVSNLTFRKNIIVEPGFTTYIQLLIETLLAAEEKHTEKSLLLSDAKLLATFGFTDLSILDAAKCLGCAVLTNEGGLYGLLSNQNYPVCNIDFVRAASVA